MNVTIRPVTEDDLPLEDQRQLVEALELWKAEGAELPMIPCNLDVDGDGTTDAYSLDPSGNLVYVTGAPVAETVYESTGGGTETRAPGLEEVSDG
ncbi:hypothetical protein SEA_MILANI_27 [Microbacterium phage Milani]|nr:hypothetical protein SEA_MILANI_27 [Microbacterium phage Milani]